MTRSKAHPRAAAGVAPAPVWIVPCLEGGTPTHTSGSSIYPAVQNMLLAARAFGLGATLIADATGGRMVFGLGVSHQPVNTTLGVDMGSPLAVLRRYVVEVESWLRGDFARILKK